MKLSKLATVGRIAASVAAPGSNIKDQVKSAASFLEDLKEKLDVFLNEDNIKLLNCSDTINLEYLRSHNGLLRKELRIFLNKADEEGRFGDLVATYYKGRYLWLCEKHHRELEVVET